MNIRFYSPVLGGEAACGEDAPPVRTEAGSPRCLSLCVSVPSWGQGAATGLVVVVRP